MQTPLLYGINVKYELRFVARDRYLWSWPLLKNSNTRIRWLYPIIKSFMRGAKSNYANRNFRKLTSFRRDRTRFIPEVEPVRSAPARSFVISNYNYLHGLEKDGPEIINIGPISLLQAQVIYM